ncbi:MAG: MBL fold metallo-hydrolase, partial [Candidatus Omnitrophica bacterium]|nr:MBL fold metallo-hydrolase [Candidatus Omnitrophota bacterium]
PRPLLSGSQADINNSSIVLKLAYKDVSLIFCGDIQEQGIEQLLRYRPMLQSTVLKVPHHGSYEGKVEDCFFEAVAPEFAVISVRQDSQFGFPALEVVEGLEEVGAQVYTTADSGAVTISTDGQNFWVKTMVR